MGIGQVPEFEVCDDVGTMPDLRQTIHAFIDEIARLVPECLEDPKDRGNEGNVSLLVISEDGQMFGRMFGDDPVRRRETSGYAWKKATQVWMTGYPTLTFEQLVFAKKVDPRPFGLRPPDFIGWPGGLPVVTDDGTKLAIAMSGFSGETDCAIIRRAVANVPGLSMAELWHPTSP